MASQSGHNTKRKKGSALISSLRKGIFGSSGRITGPSSPTLATARPPTNYQTIDNLSQEQTSRSVPLRGNPFPNGRTSERSQGESGAIQQHGNANHASRETTELTLLLSQAQRIKIMSHVVPVDHQCRFNRPPIVVINQEPVSGPQSQTQDFYLWGIGLVAAP